MNVYEIKIGKTIYTSNEYMKEHMLFYNLMNSATNVNFRVDTDLVL